MRLSRLGVILAATVVSGFGCTSSQSRDGGSTGGGSAQGDGGGHCASTSDCLSAGKPDTVCDPIEKVCVKPCTTHDDCKHVSDGVCEPLDGTCRSKCNGAKGDYCRQAFSNKVCDDDKGTCIDACKQDTDCTAIKPGSACTETTGKCDRPAHACNFDYNCNTFDDPKDYCYSGGTQCFCSIENNDAGTNGVCHRRNRPCTECKDDKDCGSADYFEPQGACREVAGETKKYCLYRRAGSPCECGYFPDSEGFCAPVNGRSCSQPGCKTDQDCGGATCNTQVCACEPPCKWDFDKKELVMPGCRQGLTCWVDQANLDPNSRNYGAGRCRPPCTEDGQCAYDAAVNPHGGDKLACRAEKLQDGTESAKRCRGKGQCMDSFECEALPVSSLSLGYCDRGTLSCKTDCRVGTDPVTNAPYQDCRTGYGCKTENGVNKCVMKTCLEQGGASFACLPGKYCCGEDKDGDGAADPCPPASELDSAGCYKAPSPPFCAKCMGPEDCAKLTIPTWQNHCKNGSKSPSCAPYPMVCIGHQNTETGAKVGVCAPATVNDDTFDSFGRARSVKGCPAKYTPIYFALDLTDNDDYCTSDDQCSNGNAPGSGHCAPLLKVNLPDGGHPKACVCTVGGPASQCPSQPDAGLYTFCRNGKAGETEQCMVTVVCVAPDTYVFRDPSSQYGGCGF